MPRIIETKNECTKSNKNIPLNENCSAYGIRTRDLCLERAVSLATRRTRHTKKTGDIGVEPMLAEPEPAVLPLDESPSLFHSNLNNILYH